MAIYHLKANVISRSAGHSSVHAAAYRARCKLEDERTGIIYDYSRKGADVLFEGVYAPKDAPAWTQDRAQLWNHVEAFEKRRDAQLARHFDMALLHELTPEQNRYVLQDWIRENFTRKGLIADAVIHAPDREGDPRNIHAHVMVVMRKLDGTEFAAKKERTETIAERKAELETLRESWERIGNRHLERYGFEPNLDRRTLLEQGIDREPTVHLGKDATALERKGEATELGDRNRAIAAGNDNERQLVDLAAERAKRTPQEHANAPLGKTAGDIRLAWQTTRSEEELTAALEERGIRLAQVTADEARASERARAFAKEIGRTARAYGEGEIVAVNVYGNVHRINQRVTGALPAEIDKRLGMLDPERLKSVTETHDAMREASRTAWREQKREQERAAWERKQPPTNMERKVLHALAVHKAGPEFAEALDKAGLRLARVTADEAKQFDADRAAFAGVNATRVPRVAENDMVVVNRLGVRRLSPHRVDLAAVEQRMVGIEGGISPSVAVAQEKVTERIAVRDARRMERATHPLGRASPAAAPVRERETAPDGLVNRLTQAFTRTGGSLVGGITRFLSGEGKPAPERMTDDQLAARITENERQAATAAANIPTADEQRRLEAIEKLRRLDQAQPNRDRDRDDRDYGERERTR